MSTYDNPSNKLSSLQKELNEWQGELRREIDNIPDLEEQLDNLVASILFEDNLKDKLPEIIYLLEKYHRFLYMFTEFEELSSVLVSLVELLNSIDFETITKQKIVSKFIISIILLI